jgi:8-oxo-dGTP diphosphatase
MSRAETAMLETRIGVGALVVRHARVLLGQRRGAHGALTWAPPGGHLDEGETPTQCAYRELFEETGLVAQASHAGPYSVDDFPEMYRRYVTLFVVITACDGEPVAREPALCEQWEWFAWHALPTPLFAPFASLVASGFEPNAAPSPTASES